MILPYLLRLLCLCFASFFVLNAACSLLVHLGSNAAVHWAETRPAKAAARLLFALRLLPVALGALFVLGFCVPSYVWFEPPVASERVGLLCASFATLGGVTWLLGATRAARTFARSRRLHQHLVSNACETWVPETASPVFVVEVTPPILAMSGLFRARPLISRGVLDSLSGEELGVALSHEEAHRFSRDNLKRLLLVFAPDPLPFVRMFRAVDDHWARLTEWSADDHATQGDSRRALALASALLRVARMGTPPRCPELSTSLLTCDRDLSERVQRLLAVPTAPVSAGPKRVALRRSGYVLAACLVSLLLTPPALSAVHQLLEGFLR